MRSVNVKAGLLCFLLDFLKGLLPTLAAKAILSSPVAIGVTLSPDLQWLLVGAVAIIGHCFPVYLMSVGGKGIATSIGVFTALLTLPSLICIVVGLTILFTTGYMALCSCVGITLLPFMTWILGGRSAMIYVIVTAIIALILDLRHAGNFRRLFNGTEPRIWDKAKGRDEGVPAA
jgi:glycerol-3-phosphate acyltransferase PlsY